MKPILLAIFDQLEYLSLEQPFPAYLNPFATYKRDFKAGLAFLYVYKNVTITYMCAMMRDIVLVKQLINILTWMCMKDIHRLKKKFFNE